MKILLSNENRGWGGGEEQTLWLAEELAGLGQEVGILAQPGSELARRASSLGFAVRTTRLRNEVDLPAYFSLAAWFRKEGFQVVHAHATRDHLLACAAARSAGVPLTARTLHNFLESTMSGLCRRAYRKDTDLIFCVSESVRRQAISMGLPGEKMEVVPNGIDTEYFRTAPTGDFSLPEGFRGKRAVGVVGHLIPKKGQDYFLSAAAILAEKFPELVFLICGEGADLPKLRARSESLSISSRVLFTGYVPDVRDVFRLLDVVVIPSLEETFSLVAAEALAMEKPVAAFSSGGIPEVVGEEAGILVPPADVEALADAVAALLQDPGRAVRMGRAGRERVEERFTRKKMAQRILGIYHERLEKAQC